MQFQELSDKQWEMIQKHLPKPASTGRPRSDDRNTINGILTELIRYWSEMNEGKRKRDIENDR